MLMNAIPSFRLEKDVVEAEIDILRELGVEFKCGVEVGRMSPSRNFGNRAIRFLWPWASRTAES